MNPRIAQLKAKQQYASLLMTYSCTIACEHCCFDCSPQKPDVVVDVDDAVEYLAELHKLDRMVHIAGGEAFKYYRRLREIVRAAHAAGVAPHFVETNCSWCVRDDITRERMEGLKDCGVLWIYLSTDPFHLKHVPYERVWRGISIAEEVFGKETTMGKVSLDELRRRSDLAKSGDGTLKYAMEQVPKLVGRAKKEFSSYFDPKPMADLQLETNWGLDPNNTCQKDWDPLWEIHVDPYGNVQTNCGIILGNAKDSPISTILNNWYGVDPTLKGLSERGVAHLVEMAVERGFVLEEAYPQKCYLCAEVRSYLREHDGDFKRIFGPDEVYEE